MYNVMNEKHLTSRIGPKLGFAAAFDTRISSLPNLSMVYERMFILIETHWAKKDISTQVKIRKEETWFVIMEQPPATSKQST